MKEHDSKHDAKHHDAKKHVPKKNKDGEEYSDEQGKPHLRTDDEKGLPVPQSELMADEKEPKDPKDKKIKELKGALVYLMENAVSANYNHVNYIKGFLND